jgi:SAM-dependent methyltransferase
MSDVRSAIDVCYSRYPEIYAAFADDRDFQEESEALVAAVPGGASSGGSFLELFAGPAYHAICVEGMPGWRAYAIDSSATMKEVALRRGFRDADRYVVGKLPAALSGFGPKDRFDCVFVARFSLGYLGPTALPALLRRLRGVLNPGGLFFAELHDLKAILGGVERLGIRHRAAVGPDGEAILCAWPDGPIKWRSTEYVAEMPVSIEVIPRQGEARRVSFVSREHIHSAMQVKRVARTLGYSVLSGRKLPAALRRAFPNSVMIVLQRRD